MATFDLFKVVAYVFDRNMPHLPCLSLSDNLPDIIWGFLRQLAQPGWPAMQCKTNAKNYLQMLFNPGCLPFFSPLGLIISSPTDTQRGGGTSQETHSQTQQCVDTNTCPISIHKSKCIPKHTVPQMRHCLNVIQSIQCFTTVMKDPLVLLHPEAKQAQVFKSQHTTGAFTPPAQFFVILGWQTHPCTNSTWSHALWSGF